MKKSAIISIIACIPVMFAVVALHVQAQQPLPNELLEMIQSNANRLPGSEQVIVVTGANPSSHVAQLYTYEKSDGAWQVKFIPMNVTIGRQGFAPPGEKQEGDLMTPTGLFRIGSASGFLDALDTKLDYVKYNAAEYGAYDTDNASARVVPGMPMGRAKRDDQTLKYRIAIEGVSSPAIKAEESPVYIRIWSNPNVPTNGCVGISEINMLKILKWLDKSRNPVIIMGSRADIMSMK